METRRFEIRPVASRRLRAALLLVGLLALTSLTQTLLTDWLMLSVGLLALGVFIHAWHACGVTVSGLAFSCRPLSLEHILPGGAPIALRCTRCSVYPWLIVLHTEAASPSVGKLRQVIVLLPDSLPEQQTSGLINENLGHMPADPREGWRQLLIWSRLMQRQLSQSQPQTPV